MGDRSNLQLDASLLARFVPMSGLDPSQLDVLAGHAALVELAAGEALPAGPERREAIHFLVEGEITSSGGGRPPESIHARDPVARFAIAGLEYADRRAVALTPSRLLRVDRATLGSLLVSPPSTQAEGARPSQTRDAGNIADVATLLLASPLLSRVPAANVHRISELIEPVALPAGAEIVRRGERGEHYFVVQHGRCEVIRQPDADGPPVRVAVLGRGDAFGEEALLAGAPCNATVRMLEAGTVLRLTREQFVNLVSAALLDCVDRGRAEELVSAGAVWIDVRTPGEFERDGLPRAVSMPLAALRERMSSLDPAPLYVVYCDTGRRSETAAFLLAQRGFRVKYLRDGIAGGRPDERATRASQRELPGLHAEIARANSALETALHARAAAEAARDIEARKQAGGGDEAKSGPALTRLAERVRAAGATMEHAKSRKRALDQQMREAEAQLASRRAQAEQQLGELRRASQARLDSERSTLAEKYRQASERLAEIARERRGAENRIASERARLDRELAQLRSRADQQAADVQAQIETARVEAEARAATIRSEHQRSEERLKRETEQALNEQRVRLERHFSSMLEAERHGPPGSGQSEVAEPASADAASAPIDQDPPGGRATREQTAQAEALRAQRESAATQLAEARRARDTAHSRRQAAERSLEQARHNDAVDPGLEQRLRSELERFDREIERADAAVTTAESMSADAAAAHRESQEQARETRSREDALRVKLYEEMADWAREEEERSGEQLELARRQAAEYERLQRDRLARREAEERATASMVSEVEQVLRGGEQDDAHQQALLARRVVEEKARLVRLAREEATARAARARAALGNETSDDNEPSSG